MALTAPGHGALAGRKRPIWDRPTRLDVRAERDPPAVQHVSRVVVDVSGREGIKVGEQHHDVGSGDLLGRGLDPGYRRADEGGFGDQRAGAPWTSAPTRSSSSATRMAGRLARVVGVLLARLPLPGRRHRSAKRAAIHPRRPGCAPPPRPPSGYDDLAHRAYLAA